MTQDESPNSKVTPTSFMICTVWRWEHIYYPAPWVFHKMEDFLFLSQKRTGVETPPAVPSSPSLASSGEEEWTYWWYCRKHFCPAWPKPSLAFFFSLACLRLHTLFAFSWWAGGSPAWRDVWCVQILCLLLGVNVGRRKLIVTLGSRHTLQFSLTSNKADLGLSI